MCGIVTLIQKDSTKSLNKDHIDIFKQMLYADALRGWDSTGIASIRMNSVTDVTKDACPPASLFHRVQEHTWAFNNQALIGHNRWATKGKTNKENAHPFKEQHITLVHNGTLKFHHHLKNVEVDSHAITHSIVEKGTKETLEMLDGAFALVWFDAQTKMIHAARNKERPLYVIETEDLYILSSEEKLALWICDRNHTIVRKTQLLTPGIIYTFKTNKKNKRYINTARFTPLEPVVTKTFFPAVKETNNVVSITPYADKVESDGLVIGQYVDVLVFKRQDLSYSCFGLGKYRWLGEMVGHPHLAVEIYTDSTEDFVDCMVNIKIHKIYFSPGLRTTMVIGENPIIPQKKTADENGPIRTSNGIELTDQILKVMVEFKGTVVYQCDVLLFEGVCILFVCFTFGSPAVMPNKGLVIESPYMLLYSME